MLLGFPFLAAGVIQYTTTPENILFNVGFLYISLALFLLMWGILGELIYKTGDLKLDHFASITRTLKNLAAGETSGKQQRRKY